MCWNLFHIYNCNVQSSRLLTNMYSFIRERFGMLRKTFLVLFHNCTVCVCVCVCVFKLQCSDWGRVKFI